MPRLCVLSLRQRLSRSGLSALASLPRLKTLDATLDLDRDSDKSGALVDLA